MARPPHPSSKPPPQNPYLKQTTPSLPPPPSSAPPTLPKTTMSSKPRPRNPYEKQIPPPLLPLPSTAPETLQKSKMASKPPPRNPYLKQTQPSAPPLRSSVPPTQQISKKRRLSSPARVSNLNPLNKQQSVSSSMTLFQVFPKGLYCSACDLPVGRGIDAVHRHVKAAHPNMLLGIDNFVQYHTKMLSAGLLSEVKAPLPISLPPLIRLKCILCEKSYGLLFSFNKHVRVLNSRCTGSVPIETPYYRLPSGHFVQHIQASNPTPGGVHPLQPDTPDGGDGSFQTFEKMISQYVRDDEDSGTFVSLFWPLMETNKKSFQLTLCDFIDRYEKPPASHEQSLLTFLAMGEKWLLERARHEVSLIPGNFRASLLQFDAQDMGEVSQNLTYNFRHFELTLLPELKKLLAFLWRSPLPFSRVVDENDPYFVVRIVTVFFHEEMPSVFDHPVIIQYTLSRFFRKSSADGSLKMSGAGQNASLAAAVLSLLRSATCSLICSARSDSDNFAHRLVRSSQLCRTANILSPIIRRLREIQRRKPKNRMVTVDVEGNVAVDGFEFPKQTWSRLVGIVLDRSISFLRILLTGNEWEQVLDVGVPLRVATLANGDMEFTLPDTSYSSKDVVLATNYDTIYIDKLISYVCLAMHGIGLGSMRLQELTTLSTQHGVWHRGTLYYSASSIKTFTHKSTGGNAVEHKLPVRLGRLFLLFRAVVRNLDITGIDKTMIVPQRTSATHSMCDAISEIFAFDQRPDATQVRHMWTSICNTVFPSGELSATVSAVDEVAEMSGHSPATHNRTYGSIVQDGREYLYRKFHEALGDSVSTDVAGSVAMTEYDLFASLEYSFGRGASYTCKAQERLVNSMLLRKHCHANLPCGAGKSAAWLLPLVAKASRNSGQQGFTIVVLPYNFLASYHRQSGENFLRNLNVWVTLFHSTDFGPAKFPQELRDDNILPDIVFLSLDALNLLIKHQFSRLERLCRHGKVARIFLDEIHTLFIEGFRSSYESLPRLASLGIPVVTMSATVPRPYLPHLLRYLKLSATNDGPVDDVITVDHGGSLLGHFPSNFRFRIARSKSPNARAVDKIKHILRRSSTHSIHVIVSSRAAAEEISTKLETSIVSRVITSESSRKVLDETAVLWKDGCIQVLISTTIGLVGNESQTCRHVIIVGYLYNLMSVVQAMGRLRENQRLDGASINVIVPKLTQQRITKFSDQSRIEYNKLVARNLVPQDWEVFQTFSTIKGIVNWIQTPGCQLANLEKIFGHNRNICEVCSGCHREALTETAMIASQANTQSTTEQHRAVDILRRLVDRCLVCNSTRCDGEQCTIRNRCHRCGGPHRSNNCPVSSKIKLIMNGVGCSYCLDVKERFGFETHDYGPACPMKRRLRRLMIQEATGSFDSFVSSVTAETKLFYRFLSTAKLKFCYVEKHIIAEQLADNHPDAPLMIPDRYKSADCEGEHEERLLVDETQARELYRFLSGQRLSRRRHRGFVFGALYLKMLGNYHTIDASGSSGISINISLACGNQSTIRLLDASSDTKLLSSVVGLGASLDGVSGNCRRELGDVGDMIGLGYRSRKEGKVYKGTEIPGVAKAMEEASVSAQEYMEVFAPNALKSIRDGEAKGTAAKPLLAMGGETGPGNCIMISRNLGNSSHFDYKDQSLSFGVWGEEVKGSATNWYFICPNVSVNGKPGLAIRLFHGAVIVWDGKQIKHCTSVTTLGEGNNVYGCMFGSCRG